MKWLLRPFLLDLGCGDLSARCPGGWLCSAVQPQCLQEERLKGLYQKHQEDRGYLAILAEDLPGSFSKGQIASQLRKLGLKKSKGKKARGMAKVTDLSLHNMLISNRITGPLISASAKLMWVTTYCLRLGNHPAPIAYAAAFTVERV